MHTIIFIIVEWQAEMIAHKVWLCQFVAPAGNAMIRQGLGLVPNFRFQWHFRLTSVHHQLQTGTFRMVLRVMVDHGAHCLSFPVQNHLEDLAQLALRTCGISALLHSQGGVL